MTRCPECQDLFTIPFYPENRNFFCPHCGTHFCHNGAGTLIRVDPILRDKKEHLEKVFANLEEILIALGAIRIKGTENIKYYDEHVKQIPAGDVADLVIRTIESQKETVRLATLARDAVRREQINVGSQWESLEKGRR